MKKSYYWGWILRTASMASAGGAHRLVCPEQEMRWQRDVVVELLYITNIFNSLRYRQGLARLGASVTGIDASKDLILMAEKHKVLDPKIANNRPEYINCTIEEHAEMLENHYDAVVASEVIEHVNNQELFVKSCIKSVRQRGKLFFTTPNRTRLSQFIVIFFAENIMRSIPKGAHQYEKFITPNELTFLLERNNCHVELTYGVSYNPITKRWDFCDYQNLMYAIQASKLN